MVSPAQHDPFGVYSFQSLILNRLGVLNRLCKGVLLLLMFSACSYHNSQESQKNKSNSQQDTACYTDTIANPCRQRLMVSWSDGSDSGRWIKLSK
jgi:hypothetical protein